MAQFGEILSELRRDKHMTQKELASELHVTSGTISNYEKGVHTPEIEKVIDLAKYFQVSLDYLLGLSTHNLFPGVMNSIFVDRVTMGDVICWISELTPDRKQALITILLDMRFSTTIEKRREEGIK